MFVDTVRFAAIGTGDAGILTAYKGIGYVSYILFVAAGAGKRTWKQTYQNVPQHGNGAVSSSMIEHYIGAFFTIIPA